MNFVINSNCGKFKYYTNNNVTVHTVNIIQKYTFKYPYMKRVR